MLLAFGPCAASFSFLGGEFGLGENAPRMQAGQAFDRGENVFTLRSGPAWRGDLLCNGLTCRFGRFPFAPETTGRRLTSTVPSWLEKLIEPDPGCCCENPPI
jgi:hypothetical protein